VRQTSRPCNACIEALFFERYTGPDSVSNGYKEVDNTLYALALATVPPLMMWLGLVCSLVLYINAQLYGDTPLAQVTQVIICNLHRCTELLRGLLLSQDSMVQAALAGPETGLDSPESTRGLYRSALKAWLEYCDLLRRVDPSATDAPWPDMKVSCCWLQSCLAAGPEACALLLIHGAILCRWLGS
jgi:hypothetical protein